MFDRIMITGGLGFIGSNLMDHLVELGHEVSVIDNLSTGLEDRINPGISECYLEDVGKRPFPEVDLIVHLAALARVQPSFRDPIKTYESNSVATMFVLEEARRMGVPVIYAGSSSCYDDCFANPYTYTKWLGEQHCKLYTKVFGVKTAIARFFNVYGPRQIDTGPYATVVGIFERQHAAGDLLTITGTGEQRRDFCHVADIVGGIEAIMKTDFNDGKPYQLGVGENYSINEVAEMFPGASKIYIEARPGEAWSTNADVADTQKRLGWKPSIRLRDYVKSLFARNQ